jgi:hypothetical protein
VAVVGQAGQHCCGAGTGDHGGQVGSAVVVDEPAGDVAVVVLPDDLDQGVGVCVGDEHLLLDGEARDERARKVDQASAGTRAAPERPESVVLASYGRGHLTVDKLFTFSQVTLVRLTQHLERYGIVVNVISILE